MKRCATAVFCVLGGCAIAQADSTTRDGAGSTGDGGIGTQQTASGASEVREVVVDLGVGARLEPDYPAAEEYGFQPWPIIDLQFLRLPLIGEVVTGRKRAISLYPAFHIVGERDPSDASYLAGTRDVDTAVELGAGVRAQRGNIAGFVEARYGVTGHSGVVADLGVDFVTSQHARFEASIGPRLSLASEDYMETYFGVGPGAAVLAPYDADGGVRSVGLEADASYALTKKVRLHGYTAYNRFVGEAGDSPIVDAGNQDEVRVGLGISYRFGLDLY